MYRIGAVSYLNSKPLIYGLEKQVDISLRLAVPSALLQGLADGQYDVALLPVIDYQKLAGLKMLRCGGIGSDGETLTVRIFSKVELGRVESMACDTDSHTSVALARVILAERYERRPIISDLGGGRGGDSRSADAMLLIGDKVISEAPSGYAFQYDLGEQWKELTGLPFLFAAWMGRAEDNLGEISSRLAAARRAGLAHVDEIVGEYARPHGWPAEVAKDYLTRKLVFEVGPRQVEAVRLFYKLAGMHGVIGEVRELEVAG